jgi:hypothetical protein
LQNFIPRFAASLKDRRQIPHFVRDDKSSGM